MFDNIGTAIVQGIGFLGVFAFFVYQLISEKEPKITNKDISKNKIEKNQKNRGIFRRVKKTEEISNSAVETKKKGWFSR